MTIAKDPHLSRLPVGPRFGDYKTGYRLGTLGIDLVEKGLDRQSLVREILGKSDTQIGGCGKACGSLKA
jgi:hypothetical protein